MSGEDGIAGGAERSRQGSMTDGDGDGGMSHGWEEDPGPNVLRLPHPFPFHLHPFCQLLKRCGESHSVCMVFSAERQWRLAPCSLAAKRSWGCRPVLCLLVVSSAELPILTSAFLILFRVASSRGRSKAHTLGHLRQCWSSPAASVVPHCSTSMLIPLFHSSCRH